MSNKAFDLKQQIFQKLREQREIRTDISVNRRLIEDLHEDDAALLHEHKCLDDEIALLEQELWWVDFITFCRTPCWRFRVFS